MIQVYTGEGKGKTTAALGLALRAAGAGLGVYIAQFCKGRPCSELKALKKFKNIAIEQFGTSKFIIGKPEYADTQLAKSALRQISRAIKDKKYDVIILDEANNALALNLLSIDELLGIIAKLPAGKELVITGRSAHEKIIEIADLVSDIKEVKHYFKNGTKARKGIEF